MPGPSLSIVIPAYNEQARLGTTLEKVLAWARSAPRHVEIIVVDDGSADRTSEVARSHAGGSGVDLTLLVNERNRGKGYSVRRGVLAARGDMVLVSDADLSTPIEEVERLIEVLARHERGLAIGSRVTGDARFEVEQDRLREMMGRVFNGLVRAMTGLPFRDTQCGFKLMTRADVSPIFRKTRIDGFCYDVELLFLTMRRGLPIEEVAVVWRHASGSKVGILTDPIRMLLDVVRVRFWHWRGLYEPSDGPGDGRARA